MKRYLLFFLSALLLISFYSCGKKGALQPPIVRVPKTAQNIEQFQRGDKIFLRWTNPINYIDGNPIAEISEVEVWLLEKPGAEPVKPEPAETIEPVQPDWEKDFKKQGQLLVSIPRESLADYILDPVQASPVMQFVYSLKKEDLHNRIFFSIRVKDKRKRISRYSNPVSFETRILPRPPLNPEAEVFENKIEIKWDAPVENIDASAPPLVMGYNVFRAVEKSEAIRLNSVLIEDKSFADTNFSFGETYAYFIRASANEASPYWESEDSEILVMSPKDTFPPAPPKGIVLVAGPNILSLSWDANMEDDLRGYRVWKKAEADLEFMLLTEDPFPENTFTDSSIERAVKYSYVITAMDKAGNESQKSDIVSNIIRDKSK